MKDIKLMSASVCPLAYGFLLDFFQVTDVYSISMDFSYEFVHKLSEMSWILALIASNSMPRQS